MKFDPKWLLEMVEHDQDGLSVGGLFSPTAMNAGVDTPPAMKLSDWTRIFPINAMRKMNFSLPKGVSDADALLQFFGVSSPDAWRAKWHDYPVAFRQTQKFDFH